MSSRGTAPAADKAAALRPRSPRPLVDSHCHLDLDGLHERLDEVVGTMRAAGVHHALCVSVTLERWPMVIDTANRFDGLSASVGVHPDAGDDVAEPSVDDLTGRASAHPRVVAIGETGLDYARLDDDAGRAEAQRERQRRRFATHIEAARRSALPLIIHTRAARDDTLALMRAHGAADCGGVMHCFTESWDMARAALDLGFHISLSGIVTFRNAADLRELARKVPADRLLVETDAPYLAPVPLRGRPNEPAWVVHVARLVADERGEPLAELADRTTDNFFRLFRRADPATIDAARAACDADGGDGAGERGVRGGDARDGAVAIGGAGPAPASGAWRARVASVAAACAMLLAAALPSPVRASPDGLWQTVDDETGRPGALMRLQIDDGVLTGRIVKVLLPHAGSTCTACRDDRSGRPLEGLEIIRGVRATGEPGVWQGGEILDPKNGKRYSVKIEEIEQGARLKVRGYLGTPLLGRTQIWNRQQP